MPDSAADRTALARSRSVLTLVVIAGSLLHAGLSAGKPVLAVSAAGLLLAAAVAVAWVGARAGGDGAGAVRSRLALLSAVAIASAVLALVVALAG